MRKLSYVSLVALALQCTAVQAANQQVGGSVSVPGGTVSGTITAPQVAIPQAQQATVGGAGGSITVAPTSQQVALGVGIAAAKAAANTTAGQGLGIEAKHWFEKELHHGEKDWDKAGCYIGEQAGACGEDSGYAIKAITNCHQFAKDAKNCFANICKQLGTATNPSYNTAVNAVLGTTWMPPHATVYPNTYYTYAQALGCNPAIVPAGSAPSGAPAGATLYSGTTLPPKF